MPRNPISHQFCPRSCRHFFVTIILLAHCKTIVRNFRSSLSPPQSVACYSTYFSTCSPASSMQLHKVPPHQPQARVRPRCDRVIPHRPLRRATKPSSSLEISPNHADSSSTVMANSSWSSSKSESQACAFGIEVDV